MVIRDAFLSAQIKDYGRSILLSIHEMVAEYGMDAHYGLLNLSSLKKAGLKEEQIMEQMRIVSNTIFEKTKELLEENQDKLESLATLLLEKETIYEKDMDEIFLKVAI